MTPPEEEIQQEQEKRERTKQLIKNIEIQISSLEARFRQTPKDDRASLHEEIRTLSKQIQQLRKDLRKLSRRSKKPAQNNVAGMTWGTSLSATLKTAAANALARTKQLEEGSNKDPSKREQTSARQTGSVRSTKL